MVSAYTNNQRTIKHGILSYITPFLLYMKCTKEVKKKRIETHVKNEKTAKAIFVFLFILHHHHPFFRLASKRVLKYIDETYQT